MNPKDPERERELFRRLADWPRGLGVVIGGYAASTLATPRFSVDMDIVVSESEHQAAGDFLRRTGFRLVKTSPALEQNYGGFVEKWEAGDPPVTVDLLVAAVQDRRFQISYPFEILADDARELQVRGSSGVSGFVARVVRPEVLIALKMQPMRPRDVGDICCLSTLPLDMERLRKLTRRLYEERPELVRESLKRMEDLLGPDEAATIKALGPRIPGTPKNRAAAAKAAREMSAKLKSWLP